MEGGRFEWNISKQQQENECVKLEIIAFLSSLVFFPVTVLLLWYVPFVHILKIVRKDGKAANVVLPDRRN